MRQIDSHTRRALRAQAHHLNPVVIIASKGLTEAVLAEIDRALTAHELIKVRVAGSEREVREALMTEICERLDCAPVQHIGNLLVLWRPKPEATPREAAGKPAASAAHAKSAKAFARAARLRALVEARAAAKAARQRRPAKGRRRTPQT